MLLLLAWERALLLVLLLELERQQQGLVLLLALHGPSANSKHGSPAESSTL